MRTTISLEDDAVEAIRAYAKQREVSLGAAASELIRRGSRYQIGIRKVNGLPGLDAPEDFPVITTEQVKELSNED